MDLKDDKNAMGPKGISSKNDKNAMGKEGLWILRIIGMSWGKIEMYQRQ